MSLLHVVLIKSIQIVASSDSPSVTSLLAAPLADNYGRRMTVRAGALVFTIGGAIQTLCTGYGVMIVGRVISGFGVGMLSMIVPIYQVRHALRPGRHVDDRSVGDIARISCTSALAFTV